MFSAAFNKASVGVATLTLVLALSPFLANAQTPHIKLIAPPASTYAWATSLNHKGATVVGSFVDPAGALNGFSYNNGKYQTINFPGSLAFTRASSVNDSGTIVGDYLGSDTHNHGYLLTNGSYTQYDVIAGRSTYLYGINNAGSLAGIVGNDGATLAFVDVAGEVTTFSIGANATSAFAINSANTVVGSFIDPNLIYTHGYSRDASGNVVQIDFPGSNITVCLGINDAGVISGFYVDPLGASHGFTLVGGKFRSSSLPDINGINDAGTFVGSYPGTNGKNYGYISLSH